VFSEIDSDELGIDREWDELGVDVAEVVGSARSYIVTPVFD